MNIKELRQVNPTQTGWLQPYLPSPSPACSLWVIKVFPESSDEYYKSDGAQ